MPLDASGLPEAARAASGDWPLADIAETNLRRTFDRRGHFPADAHWTAIRAIFETMQAMADGTADAVVHLASLDPGLGKSSAVVAVAAALTELPAYADVGVLVAVGRLAEAESLLREMREAGIGAQVAALTSDNDLNGLSGCEPTEAQVLIVTQQALELRTRHRTFGAVSGFFYRGRPRQCRVWDEAWEAAAPVTLERDPLLALIDPARKISGAFRDALEELTDRLRDAEHDSLLDVPEWETAFGVCEADLLGAIQGGEGEQHNVRQATASGLFTVSGRSLRVHRENHARGGRGRVFVSYDETFPTDFAPLLVLDASVRVKQTYADAVAFRGLRVLPSAVKDYSPMPVHLWETSASKTGWKENGDALVEGIVATILTKPSERWLIVGHKQLRRGVDVPAQITRALPPSMASRVSFISWGRHAATNEFRDYENVVLASNYFLPPLTYLAKTHAARGLPPEAHGFAGPDDVKATTWGEHSHHILQAACRGRCRQVDGTRCLPMSLYIIAAKTSGITRPETVERIFPGARIVRWCPVAPRLRGKAFEAAAALDRLVDTGRLTDPADFISYGDLLSAMVGKDGAPDPMRPAQFNERVARKEDWQAHIASLGLTEDWRSGTRGGRPQRGLRMTASGELVDRFPSGQDQ